MLLHCIGRKIIRQHYVGIGKVGDERPESEFTKSANKYKRWTHPAAKQAKEFYLTVYKKSNLAKHFRNSNVRGPNYIEKKNIINAILYKRISIKNLIFINSAFSYELHITLLIKWKYV